MLATFDALRHGVSQAAIRELAELVVQCTAFSPDARPSFAKILQVNFAVAEKSKHDLRICAQTDLCTRKQTCNIQLACT